MLLAQIAYPVTVALVLVFLFVSVLMILAVLIQRPAGGGLSGAFGSGAGSGQTAFGAKTGDALTIATIIIFLVYLLFAIGLNYAARPGPLPGTGTAATTPAEVPQGPLPATMPGTERTPAEGAPATPTEAPATLPPPVTPEQTPPPPPGNPPGEQPAAPTPTPPAPEPAGPGR